ncbi:MAG: hypothetical protein HND51_14540 [Chloroflexi bacterium]|nr:hypothetical protein [Chloroflexota bacterium]
MKFILYGNGHLVISHTQNQLPLEKYLERQEVCQILNTVDEIGFLGCSPNDLPPAAGLPSTSIEVNSWETAQLNSINLGFAFHCLGDNPPDSCQYIEPFFFQIPNTAKRMFDFLTSHQTEGMSEYSSQELLIWFDKPIPTAEEFTWPLDDPSLLSLSQQRSCNSKHVPIALASNFYELFIENQIFSYLGFSYTEKSIRTSILYRPLWPYEYLDDDCDVSATHGVYDPQIPNLPETITCTPEDGLFQIP